MHAEKLDVSKNTFKSWRDKAKTCKPVFLPLAVRFSSRASIDLPLDRASGLRRLDPIPQRKVPVTFSSKELCSMFSYIAMLRGNL
jgi:hypothetical protein